MMNIKKVGIISDIMFVLEEDPQATQLVGQLKMITYAPNLGYRNWIFKYKGMYLLFFDRGNGCYQYLCPVSWFDALYARIYHKLDVWGVIN